MRASDGPDSVLDPPGRRSRLKPGGLTCALPDVCEAGPHLRSPLQIRDARKTDREIRGEDNAPPAGRAIPRSLTEAAWLRRATERPGHPMGGVGCPIL